MRTEDYVQGTRHPWSALVFVLPLLVAYEAGLVFLSQGQTDWPRHGADSWLRWALANVGMAGLFWLPIVLLVLLLVWSFCRREDRPGDLLNVWVGMLVESLFFAAGLWGLSGGFFPFLESLGLTVAPISSVDPGLEQVLSYLGAGIYEETVFRLLLFAGLIRLFHLVEIPSAWALTLAAVVSALAFALAHNLGQHGEVFQSYVFLFRTLAGLYFALLFHWRGFGIAVGAHIGYDVLVGLFV